MHLDPEKAAAAVVQTIAMAVKPLTDRVAVLEATTKGLEQRLDALEGRGTAPEAKARVVFRGEHSPDRVYMLNDACMRGGHGWRCMVNYAVSRPGEDPIAWRRLIGARDQPVDAR